MALVTPLIDPTGFITTKVINSHQSFPSSQIEWLDPILAPSMSFSNDAPESIVQVDLVRPRNEPSITPTATADGVTMIQSKDNEHPQSKAHLPLGAKVGMGLGIPIVVALSSWICCLRPIFKRKQSRAKGREAWTTGKDGHEEGVADCESVSMTELEASHGLSMARPGDCAYQTPNLGAEAHDGPNEIYGHRLRSELDAEAMTRTHVNSQGGRKDQIIGSEAYEVPAPSRIEAEYKARSAVTVETTSWQKDD